MQSWENINNVEHKNINIWLTNHHISIVANSPPLCTQAYESTE